MRLTSIIFLNLIFHTFTLHAQKYEDYIGAGHARDIKVISSSSKSEYPLDYIAGPETTVNGAGMDAELMKASRLLTQATLGPDMKTIKSVAKTGIEPWIDDQLEKPASVYLEQVRDIFHVTNQWRLNHGDDSTDLDERANWSHFMYAWWENNMFNEDLLRQRVALALSEILVTSVETDLSAFGEGVASYYDIFSKNAFGNYKDILKQVTYHPVMGFYLSHLNNPRTISSENIHPDENFAREVMQLFTIGLYELNNDGSRKTDANGKFIPTYNNDNIKEMAKVFTGLGPGAIVPNEWVAEPDFGYGIWITDMTKPMKMYPNWHEPGEKTLLNGYAIPAGNSGDKDIELAVDHLFNHPNVGPFISKQLIQKLIKSNPSPQYIDRIASVFNNNGNGVRGDLKSVIKAILTDDEARNCEAINDPSNGKLKEPLLRFTQFARAIEKDQAYGNFWNIGYSFWRETGQMIMSSPSVFNFFLPSFQPIGPLADAGLIGPEFQIHNTKTSIGYMNMAYYWTRWESLFENWLDDNPNVSTDFYKLEPLARNPEILLNYIDVLFTYGMLTDDTRKVIKETCNELIYNDFKHNRASLATYLMLISPDFNIQK
jgi:uncharacterized protein (DUF1800 family)